MLLCYLPGIAVYALVRECRVSNDAAWERDFDKRLREADLNVNDHDIRYATCNMHALHWACFFNDPAACRFLLGRGVDVDAKADVFYCPNDCVHDESYYSVHDMVRIRNSIAKPPRTKDLRGVPALFVASNMGSVEMVELLLDAKADARARGSGAYSTALRFALENKHFDVVMPLLRAGAGSDAEDGWWSGDLELVQALEFGAPNEVVFEMVCRGARPGTCDLVETAVSSVRFAALARAIGFEEDFPAVIAEALQAPGAKAEVEQLAEQFKADFALYCEKFEAEKAQAQEP